MGNALARSFIVAFAVTLFGAPFLHAPVHLQAQQAETAEVDAREVTDEEFESFVRAHLAIEEVRDQLHEDIARWHEDHRREEVRAEADARIEAVFERFEMTPESFQELTRLVSINEEWRQNFQETLARID